MGLPRQKPSQKFRTLQPSCETEGVEHLGVGQATLVE